jgi:hypothetical protein
MQGLKPINLSGFAARLKSCPDTKHEFFRNLQSGYGYGAQLISAVPAGLLIFNLATQDGILG